jgi:hypothetical protein
VIEGSGKIIQEKRKTTRHDYTVHSQTDKVRIRENTLYFPNWEVYVDGKKTNIEFQDRLNRGLITYWLPMGEHRVSIQFKDTKLRMVANLLSILTFVTIFIAVVAYGIWRSMKKS